MILAQHSYAKAISSGMGSIWILVNAREIKMKRKNYQHSRKDIMVAGIIFCKGWHHKLKSPSRRWDINLACWIWLG